MNKKVAEIVRDYVLINADILSNEQRANIEKLLHTEEPTTKLTAIHQALATFDEMGTAVITSNESHGIYALEVASYVVDVLRGLKCSFEYGYNAAEGKVTIRGDD